MNRLFGICFIVAGAIMIFAGSSFAAGLPVPQECLALGGIVEGVSTQKCCDGLSLGDIKENYDKNCTNLGAGGYGGICIACGNGVCDPAYETFCNCPEDCTKVKKDRDDNRDKDKHDKKDKDKHDKKDRDDRRKDDKRRDGHDDRDHGDGDRGDRGGMMQQ